MSIPTEDLHWKYITEGGSNIILSSGKYILRVRKCGNKRNKMKIGNTFSLIEEEKFFRNIVMPLFSDTAYLTSNKCIDVKQGFLKTLQGIISKDRPEKRKFCGIDYAANHALLMPNLAHIFNMTQNCIAIEIKPKCGYLPSFYTDSSKFPFKNNVCRFCMHQKLKFKEENISAISTYCPINMYAQCSCRVHSALTGLFNSPQNNLSVMFGGKRVSEDFFINNAPFGLSCNTDIIDILLTILYQDSLSSSSKKYRSDTPFCSESPIQKHSATCKVFGRKGIFKKLKNIQEWDEYGMEKIMSLYEQLKNNSDSNLEEFSDFTSTVWRNFNMNSVNDENDIKAMLKYLIASTLKDITVIITFTEVSSENRPLDTSNFQCIQWNGRSFVYQIKIVDLDPKYIHNIPFYHQLDQNISANYAKHHLRK